MVAIVKKVFEANPLCVAKIDFFPGLSRRDSMVSFASLWIF